DGGVVPRGVYAAAVGEGEVIRAVAQAHLGVTVHRDVDRVVAVKGEDVEIRDLIGSEGTLHAVARDDDVAARNRNRNRVVGRAALAGDDQRPVSSQRDIGSLLVL